MIDTSQDSTASTSRVGQSSTSKSGPAQAFKKRYRDAYLVARATDAFGSGIKGIGVLLAFGLIIIAFYLGSSSRDGGVGIAIAIASGSFGIFSGTLLYLLGVLVSSQGQILKASLDGSVNTSPFLTDDDRAEMMSISNS